MRWIDGGATLFNVRNDMISTYTGLVAFDASSIPAGTTVVRAQLELTTTSGNTMTSGEVQVYRVLEAWTEGTGNGAVGVANYDDRQTGSAWTTPGCGAGSRDATPLASLMPYGDQVTYTVSIPAGPVQQWVDDPSQNHGFALVASGAGTGQTVPFGSREGAGVSPTLRVIVRP